MSPAPNKRSITAKEEFEKNPDLKQEDLNELRQWLITQRHLPQISEEMLILFHHSCYYQLPATKDCIEMFYTMRTNTPEIFTKRDINEPSLASALSTLNFAVSPVPDSDGNQVVYYSLRDTDPSKYNHNNLMKVFCMIMDTLFLEEGTQSGLVIVYNMVGLKFSHLARITLFTTKKFFQFIQEANPVRLKKIHVINVVPLVDKLLALLRPFMKKEFYSLLHFHKDGMEEFYNDVSPKCLPKEAGGTLDTIDELNGEINKKLATYVDFFLQDEKMRVDETKREKRKKSKQGKEESIITFQKLEID